MAKYVPPQEREGSAGQTSGPAPSQRSSGGRYIPPSGSGFGGPRDSAQQQRPSRGYEPREQPRGMQSIQSEPQLSRFDALLAPRPSRDYGGRQDGRDGSRWEGEGSGRLGSFFGDDDSYLRCPPFRTLFPDADKQHSGPAPTLDLRPAEVRYPASIDFRAQPFTSYVSLFDGTDNSLGFPAPLIANIRNLNYLTPTPIQAYSIPIAAGGLDIVATSMTGSGKTAGFLIPITIRILREQMKNINHSPMRERDYSYKSSKGSEPLCRPLALILAPTRELAQQTTKVAYQLTYKTPILTRVFYGGGRVREQTDVASYGCDILVATPGRLIDLLERGLVSLDYINILVLDEADKMMEMGFNDQIHAIITKFGMPPAAPDGRQTLLFSATFPRSVEEMARAYLCDPVRITVKGFASIKQDFILDESSGHGSSFASEKMRTLVNLIESTTELGSDRDSGPKKPGSVLLFVDTKRDCADLARVLSERYNIAACAIHGDLEQQERQRVLGSFRNGDYRVLVATDVAQRGLDIPVVAHVINFGLPRDLDDYTHRIGRTGRANRDGQATTFISRSENPDSIRRLLEKLQDQKQEAPEWLQSMASGYGRRSGGDRRGGGRSGYGGRGGSRGGYGGGGYRDREYSRERDYSRDRDYRDVAESEPRGRYASRRDEPEEAW